MSDGSDRGFEAAGDPSGIDPERARLIDSIYEAVLRPEHYDVFMADWAAHLDHAAAELMALRSANAAVAETLDDPLIEVHFNRAFAILERMGRGPATEAAGGVTDATAPPLLIVDRSGVLRAVSTGAAQQGPFGSEPTLASVLEALEPDSARRFRALFEGLRRAPVVGQMAVLELSGLPEGTDNAQAKGAPAKVAPAKVAPDSAAQPEAEALSRLVVALTRRDALGGVELALCPLALRWSATVSQALTGSFRLSPREIDLVRALAAGQDLAAVARSTGRSLNTLRAQLKSVFQKTRSGSQAELMRLIAALILFVPGTFTNPPAEALSGVAPPDPGRLEMIPGHDGQPVPVHFIGPQDGRPVIFVHGMLDGIAVTRHIGRALQAAGLQLIAPERRNFGQAAPDPDVRGAPDIFARDLEAICDGLGLDRVLILGQMAGAVPAFATAARLQGRAAGVLNISGGVPIRSLRQFALMSPRQRAVAYTARFAPALLPAILRAGIAQIDGKDAEAFMAALYPEGSRDREVVSDPEVAATIIDGYRFSVAQGEQAFRIDSWHVTRDWSALVAACPVPIRLIHGALDPVVRIETVRDFAATSNRITLDEWPDEGQLLFYSQPQRVLAVAAEMLSG